ncbi:MAG: sulfotransferase family 2 domain-containing protein [Pseudomonadota bacterium]
MTVILKQHKLFCANVPKVACTSIKRMFFEIENGFPFQPYRANGHVWHIHAFYKGVLRRDFPESAIAQYRRLAVVRHPIKRFLSAYSNRVVHHKEISESAVRKLGGFKRPPASPDLGEFVDRFETYQKIQSIGWHCRPMVDFLGHDPNYYQGLYGIHQIDEFLDDVANSVGKRYEVGRYQTGGPKFSPSDLTAKQTAKLEKFYAADYKAFSQYF